MVVREQQPAGPLHFGEGGGGAGAEVLQAHLVLWREFNRILGERSWPNDSPPDDT
jgi:hypothetical protein